MTREQTKALEAAERLVVTCDVLAELVTAGYETYTSDVRTQWAIEMGLIRVGEGVSRIPEGVREQFPGQPWRIIVDMRNIAAHQYDTSATRRVWNTLLCDIPALREYVVMVMLPVLREQR